MKYPITIHEFSFNKIKNDQRKIAIHLFDKKTQQIKLHDILVMRNTATKEEINCEVIGIGIFDNFNDLVDALGHQALGYDNKEEVMIRINRIYPLELQKTLSAVAFFFKTFQERNNTKSREAIERI